MKLLNIIKKPYLILLKSNDIGLIHLSDKQYIKYQYKKTVGKDINLINPTTFGEKLNWLKLNDRNEKYTQMVDKYLMKEYIKETIGDKYVVPLIGVWDSPEQIDFDKLPNKFVLKCNHNSGTGMFICRDKTSINKDEVFSNLKKGLKEDYYEKHREWPYKNVSRKIIAEKFLETGEDYLTDYKFFCFNGIPKIMYISQDYSSTPTTDFYDMNFNKLDLRMKDPNSNIYIEKPQCFDEMREIATKLAKDIPFLRVDFYYVNKQIYVGELTFYHNAGFCKISPEIWNTKLGNWIDLSGV